MLKNIAAVICAIALLTTATLAFSSESLKQSRLYRSIDRGDSIRIR